MQGGWAGAELLPPPARPWGAKGFLPWASGAAGEGGMQRGDGAYRPPTPGGVSRPGVRGQDSPPGAVLDRPLGPGSSGQAKIPLSIVKSKK